jgi:hypothetical protein
MNDSGGKHVPLAMSPIHNCKSTSNGSTLKVSSRSRRSTSVFPTSCCSTSSTLSSQSHQRALCIAKNCIINSSNNGNNKRANNNKSTIALPTTCKTYLGESARRSPSSTNYYYYYNASGHRVESNNRFNTNDPFELFAEYDYWDVNGDENRNYRQSSYDSRYIYGPRNISNKNSNENDGDNVRWAKNYYDSPAAAAVLLSSSTTTMRNSNNSPNGSIISYDDMELINRLNRDDLSIDNMRWLAEKPISVLQLDPADRAVLKIAGKHCFSFSIWIINHIQVNFLIIFAFNWIWRRPTRQDTKEDVYEMGQQAFV